MSLHLSPASLCGRIAAIPSKSDAHRALIAASLGDRPLTLSLPVLSEDLFATIRCLRALGADIAVRKETCTVSPILTPPKEAILPCGESGSTLRFLLPVAAALGVRATFTGEGRLPARPLADLLAALTAHGVTVSGDTLPLTLSGHLRPGTFTLPGHVSSQYLTGLLLAFPLLNAPSRLRLTTPPESVGYLAMTVRTLSRFGITAEKTAEGYTCSGGPYRTPDALPIEGDWSDAAVFLAAGALGGPVTVTGLCPNSPQGDRAILSLLRQFGAKVTVEGDAVTVSAAPLTGIPADLRDIPDLLPVLAVLGAAAEGTTRLYNAARTRLKECDRLHAMAELLTALGGQAAEEADALILRGGPLSGGQADDCADHRIVMAAALAALIAAGPVTVPHPEAVAKSHPDFFRDYQRLGGLAHE